MLVAQPWPCWHSTVQSIILQLWTSMKSEFSAGLLTIYQSMSLVCWKSCGKQGVVTSSFQMIFPQLSNKLTLSLLPLTLQPRHLAKELGKPPIYSTGKRLRGIF